MATTKKAPAKKAAATKKAAPAVVTIRTPEGAVFTNNGQPIVRTRPYSLSFMAQEHGRGIDGPGIECSVARFREVLATLGVKDPLGASWEVTLPNGHVVGFAVDGKVKAKSAAATKAAKSVARTTARVTKTPTARKSAAAKGAK